VRLDGGGAEDAPDRRQLGGGTATEESERDVQVAGGDGAAAAQLPLLPADEPLDDVGRQAEGAEEAQAGI
jgi:hypothetical protein